jgi:PAS domain S-box-containing protein
VTGDSVLGTDRFSDQLQRLQDQLATLRQDVPDSPTTELVSQALAELSVTVEELRVAEEELREQADELAASRDLLEIERRRYLDLFEFAPDGYLVTDANGVIHEVNRPAAMLLGRPTERLRGKPLAIFVAPRELPAFRLSLAAAAKAEAVQVWDSCLKGPDHAERDVECMVAPVRDPRRGHLLELRWRLHDITDRKRGENEVIAAHENLRTLSKRVEDVREEERSKIARAVHDEIGAALTAIKIDVSQLRHGVEHLGAGREGGQQLLARADAAAHLIDSTMQTVRRISMELRPAILDDFGLVAALDWQLNEFQKRTQVETKFNVKPGSQAVKPEVATAVFRVFQEILTNIARHASASRVTARLFEDKHTLVLSVSDNGRGIRPEEAAGSESMGLMGMRERVRPFGGSVEIMGETGAGTLVRVRIPLAEAAAGAEATPGE